MASHAYLTELQRATERLNGLLSGISSDHEINDDEIEELYKWLNQNGHLRLLEPFREVFNLLQRCLDDNVIDELEREEILEWCIEFCSENPFPDCVTNAIRRLHGMLHGIILDNEVRSLYDWLQDYKIFKEYWPFCEIWQLIENVLEDGIVTEQEKAEVKQFCENFTEIVIPDSKINDEIYLESFMQSGSQILQPFTALCDRTHSICFGNRSFCFTGPARTGSRKALFKIVKSLGGKPSTNVSYHLDYLVIGAQSSPAWAYSTYGRKIEAVIDNRKKGCKTIILHEDDFIKQAK